MNKGRIAMQNPHQESKQKSDESTAARRKKERKRYRLTQHGRVDNDNSANFRLPVMPILC